MVGECESVFLYCTLELPSKNSLIYSCFHYPLKENVVHISEKTGIPLSIMKSFILRRLNRKNDKLGTGL